MLHSKLHKQQVTSNWGAVHASGYSPISKRIVRVENYDTFQKKVKIVSILIATALFTSPIWAMYLLKTLVQ